MKEKPRGEQGAPAALRAIEEHEVACRAEKDEAQKAWKQAQLNLSANTDDEILMQIERRTHNQYLEELEIWDDATKKLALFDKQVVPSAREGEKITRAEAEEFFHQFIISLELAIESYAISIAQEAARGISAEDFYKAHSENMRACKQSAIERAQRDGKLPKWASLN